MQLSLKCHSHELPAEIALPVILYNQGIPSDHRPWDEPPQPQLSLLVIPIMVFMVAAAIELGLLQSPETMDQHQLRLCVNFLEVCLQESWTETPNW